MSPSELKLKVVVGETANATLSSLFPKSLLLFQKNQTVLREFLYRPEAGLLLLPAIDVESIALTQRIRRDRYLEVLPIVFYSDKKLSLAEMEAAMSHGVTDFLFFDSEKLDVSKKRILNVAEIYWKLKKDSEKAEKDDLTRSVEFLDSLIEHLPNMVFVKDAKELRFVRFNRAGEKLLGYSRSDLIGKNDYDFFPKDQADHFTQKDRDVISSGQLLDIAEEPIHTKEGLRVLHTRKIPLYDERGNPSYLLGISEDITELKKAEHERLQLAKEQTARTEAEKAIQVRDDFISIASHELKTPLTSLDLHFQIIKRWLDKKDYSEPAFAKLKKIYEESSMQLTKLSNLIEDLLDVTRVQRGKLTFNFEEANLKETVSATVLRLGDQIKAMGCELHLLEMEDCFCRCDPFRIDQAVSNLLSNSMKYAQGKPIEISLVKKGNYAELCVRDHGVGIAPENHKKIFERFERAVSYKNISGLGLGLYITKEIVEAHNGTISVESEITKGATFRVKIPLLT